jgi:hypothetical protein
LVEASTILGTKSLLVFEGAGSIGSQGSVSAAGIEQ